MAPKYSVIEKATLLQSVFRNRLVLVESNALRFADANQARKYAWAEVITDVQRATNRPTTRERCKSILTATIAKLSKLAAAVNRFKNETGNEQDLDEEEELDSQYIALTDEERMLYDEYKESEGWIGLSKAGDTLSGEYSYREDINAADTGEMVARESFETGNDFELEANEWGQWQDETVEGEENSNARDIGVMEDQTDPQSRRFPDVPKESRDHATTASKRRFSYEPEVVYDSSTKRGRYSNNKAQITEYLSARNVRARGQLETGPRHQSVTPRSRSDAMSTPRLNTIQQPTAFQPPKVPEHRESERRNEATERNIRLQSLANLQEQYKLIMKQQETAVETCLLVKKTAKFLDVVRGQIEKTEHKDTAMQTVNRGAPSGSYGGEGAGGRVLLQNNRSNAPPAPSEISLEL